MWSRDLLFVVVLKSDKPWAKIEMWSSICMFALLSLRMKEHRHDSCFGLADFRSLESSEFCLDGLGNTPKVQIMPADTENVLQVVTQGVQMPAETEYFLRVVNRHSDRKYCVKLKVDGNDALLHEEDFKPLYERRGVNFKGFQQSYRKKDFKSTSEEKLFTTGSAGRESTWTFSFYENKVSMTYKRGGGREDKVRQKAVKGRATKEWQEQMELVRWLFVNAKQGVRNYQVSLGLRRVDFFWKRKVSLQAKDWSKCNIMVPTWTVCKANTMVCKVSHTLKNQHSVDKGIMKIYQNGLPS